MACYEYKGIKYTEEELKSVLNQEQSKTRRILELQSDLFQRGRNNKYLISNLEETVDELGPYTSKDMVNSNQFLQLLNKKNNWVTFFVKSIIQDSAKKGYEKVLFPKGDTAAKIEGHQTLKEFKKQKEDRIKKLENIVKDIESGKNFQPFKQDENKWIPSSADKEYEETKYFYTKEEAIDYSTKSYKNEIKTLKQELADVESGQTQLSSIAKFYETTVTNILKKNGYNPIEVTDEYGNKWNEVTITPEVLSEILLQKNEAGKIIGQANIKAATVLIDAVNKKQDTLPHEYAHHYIAWFRNTPIVQEGIKRFGSEEALVQAIGEQVVKQKGEAYNWWKKFTNFIINLLSDKQLLQILTDSFLNRTNLNTDFTYNKITPQQKQEAQQLYSSYLNTIFPDSKVKDIVYHVGNDLREGLFNIIDTDYYGTYFSPIHNKFKGYDKNGGNYAIINIQNPTQNLKRVQSPEDTKEYINLIESAKELKSKTTFHGGILKLSIDDKGNINHFVKFKNEVVYDKDEQGFTKVPKRVFQTILLHKYIDPSDGYISEQQFLVFEPEQIHVLGSKQDVEGFKEFMEQTSGDSSELRDFPNITSTEEEQNRNRC